MQTRSAGQVMAAAEAGEGEGWGVVLDRTSNAAADVAYARRIRAGTEEEAGQLVATLRRGSTLGALGVGLSTALGALGGALAQKAIDNFGVKGIPASAPAGAVVATLGTLAPLSAHTRHSLVAGGTAWVAGSMLYHRHGPMGGMP
ncbi:MAG TPA: hypothetical protein PKW35_15395 [Nannocystaceae bacterium]|nr:hypothetical protein [Nannocystaceae bacterium]